MIADGFCQCGCGAKTNIVTNTDKRFGLVKGQPRRYLQGHSLKRPRKCNGYAKRLKPSGDVESIHRIRAEQALGHALPPKAIVHHADGSQNRYAPLVICQDQAYHLLLHERMRIVKAGGHPEQHKICSGCRQLKDRSEFHHSPWKRDGLHIYCKACRHDRQMRWRKK